LKARGLLPKFDAALDAFLHRGGRTLRGEIPALVHDLRAAGYALDYLFHARQAGQAIQTRPGSRGRAHGET